MTAALAANAVLDRVYLEIRCKLLDVAACLDRVERAEGGDRVQSDPRLMQIKQGIGILSSGQLDRAERIQMLFSDAYIANWNRREKPATNGAERR
ncbi:MAG TPA: hypothetical protein VKU82_07995 [Planctomycetaceae bacterium]|nr:hypothetical protein [Planctomycetaceae bacterium]